MSSMQVAIPFTIVEQRHASLILDIKASLISSLYRDRYIKFPPSSWDWSYLWDLKARAYTVKELHETVEQEVNSKMRPENCVIQLEARKGIWIGRISIDDAPEIRQCLHRTIERARRSSQLVVNSQ